MNININSYTYTLWCIFLFSSFGLFGQTDWQFETHSNNITGISIDSQWVWLSTRDGIFKFNSETGEKIKFSTSESNLTDDYMTGILVMPDDSVWVSYYYYGAGHAALNPVSWNNYEVDSSPLRSNFVRTMERSPSGAVFMGTFYGGVNIYKDGEWSFIDTGNSPLPISNYSGGIVEIAFDDDTSDQNTWFGTRYQGLYHQEDTTWTRYDIYNSPIPNHIVSGLALDKHKNVWVGTHDGLAVKDSLDVWHVFKQEDSPLPTGFIRDLAVTDSSVWVATTQGLIQIPTETMAVFDTWDVYLTENSELPTNILERLALDTMTGDLWIGTYSKGLVRFDGSIWESFDFKDSDFVDNDVLSLHFSEDSTLMVGTRAGGLGLFKDSIWTILDEEHTGLSTNQVNFSEMDTSGNVWIGYSFDGLSKWNGTEIVHYNETNSPLQYPLNIINDVHIDDNDLVWLAVNEGLWSFNHQDSIWTFHNADDSGLNQDVTAIAPDGKGGFWYGGRYNSLKHYTNDTIIEYDTPDHFLDSTFVTDLSVDEWDNIWIGTFTKGLLKMDVDGNWYHFDGSNSSIKGNSISSLEYTPDSTLWIGTIGAGLYTYKLGAVKHFDVYSGDLPQNNVADLVWDPRGNLWIGMPQMGLGSHHIDIFVKPVDTLATNYITAFTGKLDVYPNPVETEINVAITTSNSGRALISFFSVNGHLIREEPIGFLHSGKTDLTFDVSDFPSGNYYLQLFVDGKIGTTVIHKQ